MDFDFCKFLLKRLVIAIAVLAAFCLLPGPRSIVMGILEYILRPESIESLSAGLHLSLIHFCWLFGFPLPALEFPRCSVPLLAAAAMLLSICAQLVLLTIGLMLWRSFWHFYYLRKEMQEVRNEFGDQLTGDFTLDSPPPKILIPKNSAEPPLDRSVSKAI